MSKESKPSKKNGERPFVSEDAAALGTNAQGTPVKGKPKKN